MEVDFLNIIHSLKNKKLTGLDGLSTFFTKKMCFLYDGALA
jgi:hypothetical protein